MTEEKLGWLFHVSLGGIFFECTFYFRLQERYPRWCIPDATIAVDV